jgi:hypothetical protein
METSGNVKRGSYHLVTKHLKVPAKVYVLCRTIPIWPVFNPLKTEDETTKDRSWARLMTLHYREEQKFTAVKVSQAVAACPTVKGGLRA